VDDNWVNKYVVILVILTIGWLISGCLPSAEPGAMTAESALGESAPEPTQLTEAGPAVTTAALPEIGPTEALTEAAPTATEAAPTTTEAETSAPGATTMSPTETAADTSASAGADADVEFVRAVEAADGTWTFAVTVRHPDTGWEDYADGWDAVTLQGVVIKRRSEDPFTRLLLHPHETEQPFTRSQAGLVIPEGVTQVIVRAHDIVDGYGGQEVTVDLSAESGSGFEVLRQ
jgi:hypothetical protein